MSGWGTADLCILMTSRSGAYVIFEKETSKYQKSESGCWTKRPSCEIFLNKKYSSTIMNLSAAKIHKLLKYLIVLDFSIRNSTLLVLPFEIASKANIGDQSSSKRISQYQQNRNLAQNQIIHQWKICSVLTGTTK